MNEEIKMKDHMVEVFRAMNTAMEARKKKSVNIETINYYVNPKYAQSVDDTHRCMDKLINTGYIRFREYLDKRYYNASKLGQERWNAYLSTQLYEIQREAEKRAENNESRPPWDVAQ